LDIGNDPVQTLLAIFQNAPGIPFAMQDSVQNRSARLVRSFREWPCNGDSATNAQASLDRLLYATGGVLVVVGNVSPDFKDVILRKGREVIIAHRLDQRARRQLFFNS
jgi:hypothetical protein